MSNEQQRPFMAELQMRQRSAGLRAGAVPDAVPAPKPGIAPALPSSFENRAFENRAFESRGVGGREILDAIATLEGKLERFLTTDHKTIEAMHVEISDIAGRIKATKVEMAALRHPLAEEDRFIEASEELTQVVCATESATNIIIGAVEQIEDIVSEVRSQLPEGYQNSRLKDVGEIVSRIYEACNFQDLTGQRINKVVQALSFIEERIEAMMSVWNLKEFEALPLPQSVAKTDGGLELHGPAKPGASISQADIDALFD